MRRTLAVVIVEVLAAGCSGINRPSSTHAPTLAPSALSSRELQATACPSTVGLAPAGWSGQRQASAVLHGFVHDLRSGHLARAWAVLDPWTKRAQGWGNERQFARSRPGVALIRGAVRPLVSASGSMTGSEFAPFVLGHVFVSGPCPLATRIQIARSSWYSTSYTPRGSAAGYIVAVDRRSGFTVLM